MAGEQWTPTLEAWIREHPAATYWDFTNAHGNIRSFDAFRIKRQKLLANPAAGPTRRGAPPEGMLYPKDVPEGMPVVQHDKKIGDVNWRDFLEPARALQALAHKASGSQDFANIVIETDRPTAVLLISDWHIGSWGTSLDDVAKLTDLIIDNGLWIASIGDMQQMSIVLRSVIEVADNMLTPRQQDDVWESWLDEMSRYLLWATWDNHVVLRQEKVTGTSRGAEVLKERTIYHSGIGHIDLTVGGQTYKIASSHRFRGNSYMNPTHGQARYMRFEGIDREIAIAGDSHRPAVQTYTDGHLPRIAVNCGSLQKDSGYAKRHFSLFTHDWMPVLEFWPNQHLVQPYQSLAHYLAARAVAA